MQAPETSHRDIPAVAGGEPLFPKGLPFVRPAVPDPDAVADDVRRIVSTGVLTNGPYVRRFEEATARYLGVRHCVAVASCTSGLMLLLRAAGLSGDVIVPSFTFAATAHAVAWNGLRPVFADVDRATLTLSSDAVSHALGVRTGAILATHTFGTPCAVEALEVAARASGVPLFFDAAHAFGSRHGTAPIGAFGDAEVFSLSPTKTLMAGEGGVIATNDDDLAGRCRIGRDYANPGDYDCQFVGLNARMSEMHAALGLRSLERLDDRIDRRNYLAASYRGALADVPGISFPAVADGDRSTFKDFTILVEPGEFGADAVGLAEGLKAEGIDTRRYYAPPVHSMRAYRSWASSNGGLPVTEWAAGRVLTLPLWTDLGDSDLEAVADAVSRLHRWYRRTGRRAGS